jgi:pimeloyl-ACP methyl ester carboxylesterase
MPFIEHDGITFHYQDQGQGIPFIFQHGLGGDVNQTFGLFSPPAGFRLLTLDCRGHGDTRPLGAVEKLGFASFAGDIRALMDHLALSSAVIGGISMGAGVSLNFALRFPDRVRGLVLSRPAWLDRPMPKNLEIFPFIAQLIRQHGSQAGLEIFKQSASYLEIARLSPDSARSLVGQFEHPRAEETVAKLERLPQDAPSYDRGEWATITVPTLVLANQQDPFHPFEYGPTLAQLIPGAALKAVTSKSVSLEHHTADVQTAIETFLKRYFASVEP